MDNNPPDCDALPSRHPDSQTESTPHIRSVSSIIQDVLYTDRNGIHLSNNYPQFSPTQSRLVLSPPASHRLTEIDNSISLEHFEYYPPSSAKKVSKLSQHIEPSNLKQLGFNSNQATNCGYDQSMPQFCPTPPEMHSPHSAQRIYQYHPYIPPLTQFERESLHRPTKKQKTQEVFDTGLHTASSPESLDESQMGEQANQAAIFGRYPCI